MTVSRRLGPSAHERRAAMRRRILEHLRTRGPSALASIANHVGDDPGPGGAWRSSQIAAAGDVWDRLDELVAEGVVAFERPARLGQPFRWSLVEE